MSLALLVAELHAQSAPGQTKSGAPPPALESRQEFSGAFTRVARLAIPAVVSIVTERTVSRPGQMFPFGDPFEFFFNRPSPQPPPQSPGREQGLGSGIIVSPDGLIITNNHVVEGAGKITVKLSDRREFDARVVGTDALTDLAVVRIQGKPGKLPTLAYGDSDSLQIGEWVVAVGAPFGLSQTVTNGIISAVGRQGTGIATYGNFIQTDAAINPGNSGGPLLDLDGRLVGVNTAIYSQSGGYQGIGFAIPVNLARQVADDLVKSGKVVRGWLGVSIQTMSPAMAEALGLKDSKGALVGDVLPGGPAEKSGLKTGDVILRVDDKPVEDANDLMNFVAGIRPGATAELRLLRDGKQVTEKVRIAERKEEATASRPAATSDKGEIEGLGLQLAPLSPQLRQRFAIPDAIQRGLVIVELAPGGTASSSNLRQGDVILEADRKPLGSVDELRAIMKQAGKGKNILLLVSRQGSTFFTTLAAQSR